MSKVQYTTKEYESFKSVVNEYRRKPYEELSKLAEVEFVDTVQPTAGVQVGVTIFYDDKKSKDIRAIFSLFASANKSRWKFWQIAERPAANEDFILTKDGKFIGE